MSDLLTLSPSDPGTTLLAPRAAIERPEGEGAAASAAVALGRDHLISAGVLGAALGYATLRYNVLKGVPWADWPSYTVNKALAVGALLLIAAAVLRLVRARRSTGTLLAWAGVLALVHSLLSFALFTPLYFPRLFEAGKLTFAAGLAMTLGVAVMAVMELGARRSDAWRPSLRHAALAWAAFVGGVHAALPALATWFDPGTWPGALPPLTLISFLAGALALGVWLGRRVLGRP
jgi:hypothetical protein